jgi:hypothetical protein
MGSELELGRRGLILGGAGLLLAPGLATAAAPGKLTFAVFRNGTKVGEHQVVIAGDDTATTATTDVAMTVKIGPVPVYKYRHRATEKWRGTQFVSVETFTEANGKKQHVLAQAGAGAVTIDGPAGLVKAAANAAPLSHWNTVAFGRPLFNQQEGKVLKVTATRMAPNHWAVRGEAEIDDWYDAAGQWQALKGKLEDGSTMEYRRI